jgi:hypothetical protein
MWQAFTNWIQGLRTYADLSPDQGIRRQINRRLRRSRTNLSPEAWGRQFTLSHRVPPSDPLLQFIYDQLQQYSGLMVGCIRPEDRLIEDLQMPLVCWFDWPHCLCEDFADRFDIDIFEDFDETGFSTVQDLVEYLQDRLRSRDSLPSG